MSIISNMGKSTIVGAFPIELSVFGDVFVSIILYISLSFTLLLNLYYLYLYIVNLITLNLVLEVI